MSREKSLELQRSAVPNSVRQNEGTVKSLRSTESEYLEMGSGDPIEKTSSLPSGAFILKKFQAAGKLKEQYSENPREFHLDSPVLSICHIYFLTACRTPTF